MLEHSFEYAAPGVDRIDVETLQTHPRFHVLVNTVRFALL